MRFKHFFLVFAFIAIFALQFAPTSSFAAPLSDAQVSAVINMLKAFGVESSVVQKVELAIKGKSVQEIKESFEKNKERIKSEVKNKFCPKIDRYLKRGDSGEGVRRLQEFLKEKGFYRYPVITGYFGAITEQALKEFQKNAGVVSYGDYLSTGFGALGPKTRRAIARFCSTSYIVNPPQNTICTMEYNPVCGVKYSETPSGHLKKVAPQYKTYSNQCFMKADGARLAYYGECKGKNSSNTSLQDIELDILSHPGSATVGRKVYWTIKYSGAKKVRYYDISWGDGTNKFGFLNAQYWLHTGDVSESFTVSHTYKEPGLYDVLIKLAFFDGTSKSLKTQVKVLSNMPQSGSRIKNLKSMSDIYYLRKAYDAESAKTGSFAQVSWDFENVGDDEWMAILLKDEGGRVHKAVRVNPSQGSESLRLDSFCNAHFSDAIDGTCRSITKAAKEEKKFFFESYIYTPKNACFGYCAPNSPKPTTLEKDKSEPFKIIVQ